MTTYTVKRTTLYPGGHAADPGYRSTVVLTADRLREYHFHSDPDGSSVRGIGTRPASTGAGFRALAPTSAAKRGTDLESAIKTHLASPSREAIEKVNAGFQKQFEKLFGR